MDKPKLIAFYLPQFYPTKENDEWWGKGFTEWTNVGRARPLFRNHYQPKVPSELGYYDLRLPEVREQQAQLAKDAGIDGFCYWHYWFNGKRLLDKVFSEVVTSGNPAFPFCLCWANHSWYAKTWDPSKPKKLLMEQTYGGVEDYIAHFNTLLPAFKDARYMRQDGKLIFGLFAPLDIDDFKLFKNTWNQLAKQNGLPEFFFFGYTTKIEDVDKINEHGFDYSVYDAVMLLWDEEVHSHGIKYYYNGLRKRLFHIPRQLDYKKYASRYCEIFQDDDKFVPCIVPNFDHSPRSEWRGTIMVNSLPQYFGTLLKNVLHILRSKKEVPEMVFIKAWNEWGEGNYMEPDLRYGRGYIEECRKAVDDNE